MSPPGSTKALEFAQDHLMDGIAGAGRSAVDGAAEQTTDAIELLEGYRARLEDLRVALASIEADLTDMEAGGRAANVVWAWHVPALLSRLPVRSAENASASMRCRAREQRK